MKARVVQGISAPDAETALAERRAKMGSVLSEVNSALEGDLRNISGNCATHCYEEWVSTCYTLFALQMHAPVTLHTTHSQA